jgi:hypothetical protein
MPFESASQALQTDMLPIRNVIDLLKIDLSGLFHAKAMSILLKALKPSS